MGPQGERMIGIMKRAFLVVPAIGLGLVVLISFEAGRAAEQAPPIPRVPPKTPAEAARTFQTLDGFRMELLASEPLVTSPVAMVYDESGRAFVVEMYDY